jgi:hypothetical protein
MLVGSPFFCTYHAKLKSQKAQEDEVMRVRLKLAKLGIFPLVAEIQAMRDKLRSEEAA